jgi:hypothetical protein
MSLKTHFSKIPMQNIGSNLYGKNEKNSLDSLHAKHKKKTKKYVGLVSYNTLRG